MRSMDFATIHVGLRWTGPAATQALQCPEDDSIDCSQNPVGVDQKVRNTWNDREETATKITFHTKRESYPWSAGDQEY